MEYECISSNLINYFTRACRLIEKFDDISFEHVSRDSNVEANELVQIASRYKLSKEKFESLIQLKDKLLNIDTFSLVDWCKPLLKYLMNP